MSATQWELKIYDGSCWCLNYNMPNPGNQSVEFPVKSTKEVAILHDGTKAFVGPETLYLKETVTFEITEASSSKTIYNQLEDFVKNNRRVDITTHDSFALSGYFTHISPVLTLSGSTQRYVIKITFEPI